LKHLEEPMTHQRIARLTLSAALLLAAGLGCGVGRQVKKATDCYKEAQYEGALWAFEDVGCCEHEMNHKALVRYLVYRGLTHYHLGHRDAARHFLMRGRDAYYHGKPHWLPRRTVAEMHHALAHLTRPPRRPAAKMVPPAKASPPPKEPPPPPEAPPLPEKAPPKPPASQPHEASAAAFH
jgi:hypothetical protein